MSEIAAGDVLVNVHRDDRGRFKAGSIGNPKGVTRSKRVAQLHRQLVRDYGGASRVTVAGRMLLEQVARLKLQAERERDPLITATLSNSIARLLAKVETYPETSRVIHGTPWWQTAKADAT